jgi:hypothetical protein
MKTVRNSLLCLAILVLAAPSLLAQDLSKYRGFSLGTSLPSVLKLTDQKPADVKIIHDRPALMQELTWWPVNIYSTKSQAQSVERIVFSFYNGDLYKISISYDRRAIQGLTAEDMIQTMTAMYGLPATRPSENKLATDDDRSDSKQKIVATWEDPLYRTDLVRTSYSEEFGLILFAKARNAEADTANAQAVTLDEQERPQREAAQLKKDDADQELARQKNIKSFQP